MGTSSPPDAAFGDGAAVVPVDPEGQTIAVVEAYLGPLFECLPVPVLLTEADGLVVRANLAARRLLCGRRLVGSRVWDVLPAPPNPAAADGVWLGDLSGARPRPVQVHWCSLGWPPAVVRIYLVHVLGQARAPQRWPVGLSRRRLPGLAVRPPSTGARPGAA